ncbi:hypothetical protein [Micromonospora craniellae]|uniref:hypothetical protein n=1 Tax=Micromonospora craniellae TaxID=2294034 RepID=UPI001CC4282C|nr:hypothetical protein [Micromonospora craniellae]
MNASPTGSNAPCAAATSSSRCPTTSHFNSSTPADVARFIRTAIEQQLTGIVNVAGPTTTARILVDTVLTHAGRTVTACRVGEEFALTHGIRPWTEIPLWLPASSPEIALMSVNTTRAVRAGRTHRPLKDSIAEALTWQALRRRWSQRWLDRSREQHLLREWHG